MLNGHKFEQNWENINVSAVIEKKLACCHLVFLPVLKGAIVYVWDSWVHYSLISLIFEKMAEGATAWLEMFSKEQRDAIKKMATERLVSKLEKLGYPVEDLIDTKREAL